MCMIPRMLLLPNSGSGSWRYQCSLYHLCDVLLLPIVIVEDAHGDINVHFTICVMRFCSLL